MERVSAVDLGARALQMLLAGGGAGDAFAGSKTEPTAIERVIGGMIWQHQGRANPISIAALAKATGRGDREIKSVVEQLVVTHRMLIGGRRGEPAGYFVIVDAEDRELAALPYRRQVIAMWRRLRVLDAPHMVRELWGQLRLEGERFDAEALRRGERQKGDTDDVEDSRGSGGN